MQPKFKYIQVILMTLLLCQSITKAQCNRHKEIFHFNQASENQAGYTQAIGLGSTIYISGTDEVSTTAILPENAPTAFYQAKLFPNRDAFNLIFSKDDQTIYFSKAAPDYSDSDIYYATWQEGEWSQHKKTTFSSPYIDFDPHLSTDGNTMYFVSNRPVDGSQRGLNIWKVIMENNQWGTPQYMGDEVNSNDDDSFMSIAANGNLYFCSNRNNQDGNYDIYVSKIENGQYRTPQKLLCDISTQAIETDPLVAPDESFLIFTRGNFFISHNKDGVWSNPVELSELINTPDAHEYTPSFSPDGKYFYFCREKEGNRDIFQIETEKIATIRTCH